MVFCYKKKWGEPWEIVLFSLMALEKKLDSYRSGTQRLNKLSPIKNRHMLTS